jgi:hypothetical protein
MVFADVFTIILVTLFFTVKATSAVAEDEDYFKSLPNELLVKIAQDVGLTDSKRLAALDQNWRWHSIINDPSVKNLVIDTYYENGIDRIASMKDKQEASSSKDILTNRLWRAIYRNDISTLNELLREKRSPLDPNRAYFVAILTECLVNWNAIDLSAYGVKRSIDWRPGYNRIFAAISGIVFDKRSANSNIAEAWNAIRDFFEDIGKSVSQTLALKNQTKTGQTDVSELIILNWTRQNNTEYFREAFNAAYEKLTGSITITEINEIINSYLEKEDLSGNPFVLQFKVFIAEAEKLIKEQSQEPSSH